MRPPRRPIDIQKILLDAERVTGINLPTSYSELGEMLKPAATAVWEFLKETGAEAAEWLGDTLHDLF